MKRYLPRDAFGWFILALVAIGAVSIWRGVSHAAETERRYEIVLTFAKPESRGHQTLGEPYESRETCRVAITRVRVHVSGARLACHPVTERTLIWNDRGWK